MKAVSIKLSTHLFLVTLVFLILSCSKSDDLLDSKERTHKEFMSNVLAKLVSESEKLCGRGESDACDERDYLGSEANNAKVEAMLKRLCDNGELDVCLFYGMSKSILSTPRAMSIYTDTCDKQHPHSCATVFFERAFPEGSDASQETQGEIRQEDLQYLVRACEYSANSRWIEIPWACELAGTIHYGFDTATSKARAIELFGKGCAEGKLRRSCEAKELMLAKEVAVSPTRPTK